MTMSQQPFIQKLTLRNFRSIRNETVTFANPLFLVGRNGSGKSNFLKSLAFLADCMTLPLQSALERNGNLWNSHASTSFFTPPIEVRVDFQRDSTYVPTGHYSFSLDLSPLNEVQIISEQCVVYEEGNRSYWFDRHQYGFNTNAKGINPAIGSQSLALPVVAGFDKFTPVLKSLTAMRVYAVVPESLRRIHEGTTGSYLTSDGSNTAAILEKSARQNAAMLERVRELLSPIVPNVTALEPASLGNNKLFLLFAQAGQGDNGTLFNASDMSDGTLSALGLIVAALQEPAPSLIAIEEPELNIHPGALDAIADIINIAAQRSQVVVTTHSPDLIDAKWITPENLRVVEWENGATHISELGEAPVKALQQHLMGAGELLRANALDAAPITHDTEDVSDLFEKGLA